MVRILSRRGEHTATPEERAYDQDAAAGGTSDQAADATVDRPVERDAADRTTVTRPAGSNETTRVARDTDGEGTRERVGPVDEERVGRVPAESAPARPRWNRVSFGATLGLILGLTALYAVLTGTLAQVGLLVGVVGFLLASSGFAGARRAGVTGHSLALLGMLASAGAVVLGVLAITGSLSWLSTSQDNVPLVRDWVDAHLPWIKNW